MQRHRTSLATLAVTTAVTVAALVLVSMPALAQSGDQIRQEVLSMAQGSITLYRGAASEAAFAAKPLKDVGSREDLVRAVASRLTSTSDMVTGLTSSPQTAGAFALGVKDGDPNTIRNMGLASGFIGVTEARNMSAKNFAGLLQKHGGSKNGLNTLLSTMAATNVVVDASGVVNALSRHYPGILTSGFQEMISASLSREAEYLVFGKNPGFKRIHPIQKADVVDLNASISGPGFKTDLVQKLGKEPRRPDQATGKQTTRTTTSPHRPATSKTVTAAVKTTTQPRARAVTRPPTRTVAKPKPRGFFRRLLSFRKKQAGSVRR